ncbi:MAG: hypothetical protein ACRDP6_22960 [Actinoallomurus sp.]
MSLSRLWHVARVDPGRILRADREVVAATLRREAGLITRRGRTAVVGALSGFVDLAEAADAPYARVLGGHTLNLLVDLPERAAAGIVLARRGTRRAIPAVPRDDGAGVEAVALLGDRPGGVGLEPGRWRILLVLTSDAGREATYALRHTGQEAADDGPTVAAPPCPDTGYRYELGRSPAGALLLTVAPPAPAAELTALRPHATGMRLTGRFVGLDDTTGAAIVFTGPGRRREHRVPALVRGDVFDVAVPVASLAEEQGERNWKVWADVPGTGRLRVGRFLTGLRSPNTVHRRPNRMVRLGDREYAMVRASYAAGGGLTLVCAAGRTER